MGAGLNRVVFQPPPLTYSNDRNLIWLTTSRNEMIPAFHIFRSRTLPTILFSHGNAEDLGMIVNYFREVASVWNVNVFAYEYTGYGLSSGTPSENNVYADSEAAYNYLTQQFQIAPSSIIVYGRSLGSAPTIHLAVKYHVKGAIIQSGILSINRVGFNLRLTLPGDMFCNIDKIHKVTCPVFIIHGVKDGIVPLTHGIQLYNACPQAVTPYWIEDAGHNNVESVGGPAFVENITRFLRFLDSRTDSAAESKKKPKRRLVKPVWRMPLEANL